MGEYVPDVLRTNKGDIIELLAHWGVDGWPQFVQFMDLDYMLQIKSAAVGLDVFKQEFDAMREYGSLFVGVWHWFCTGRLVRWIEVVKLIEHMLEKSGVWLAPMEETAAHVKNASTTAGTPRASTNLHTTASGFRSCSWVGVATRPLSS